jgi:5-methylcytosine-specific restriction endonuclease McrBC GTP-binding regulatory subunit McrB
MIAIINLEQKDLLVGQEFSAGQYFNPVQDGVGNWIISQEEIDACNNEFAWVKQLELSEYIPKQDLDGYKNKIDTDVQELLNAKAKEYRYDNMEQVTQFAAVEGEFQNEAIGLLEWNARIWELTEAHIATVTEIPTEDFILTLPTFA